MREALGLGSSFGLGSLNVVDSARNFLSGGALTTVANVGAGVASVISYLVVIVIATIYSVAQPGRSSTGSSPSFQPGGGRRCGGSSANCETIQRWFVGQLASMLLIGVLSTVALYLIGVPFALLLGIFSGLISFIPFVGPLISVIPPLLLALIGTPIDALWVVLAYAAIQTIESYLIQPLVMSRAVSSTRRGSDVRAADNGDPLRLRRRPDRRPARGRDRRPAARALDRAHGLSRHGPEAPASAGSLSGGGAGCGEPQEAAFVPELLSARKSV